jgi:hypothetical protein
VDVAGAVPGVRADAGRALAPTPMPARTAMIAIPRAKSLRMVCPSKNLAIFPAGGRVGRISVSLP